jgi:hypothetical protein
MLPPAAVLPSGAEAILWRHPLSEWAMRFGGAEDTPESHPFLLGQTARFD